MLAGNKMKREKNKAPRLSCFFTKKENLNMFKIKFSFYLNTFNIFFNKYFLDYFQHPVLYDVWCSIIQEVTVKQKYSLFPNIALWKRGGKFLERVINN